MFQLDAKKRVIIVVAYTAIVAAGAYRFGPSKVIIQKETVKQETDVKKTDDLTKTNAAKDRHIKKVISETVNKDGSKQTTTTITEDDSVKKSTDSNKKSADTDNTLETTKLTKIVERPGARINISVLGGVPFQLNNGLSTGPFLYGASVNKEIIGPVTVGVWGLSNATGGLSLGVDL